MCDVHSMPGSIAAVAPQHVAPFRKNYQYPWLAPHTVLGIMRSHVMCLTSNFCLFPTTQIHNQRPSQI